MGISQLLIECVHVSILHNTFTMQDYFRLIYRLNNASARTMMIEQYFNFLNTLTVSNESFDSIRIYIYRKKVGFLKFWRLELLNVS